MPPVAPVSFEPLRDFASFWRSALPPRVPGAVDYGGGQRGQSGAFEPRHTFNDAIRDGADLVASFNPGRRWR